MEYRAYIAAPATTNATTINTMLELIIFNFLLMFKQQNYYTLYPKKNKIYI